MQDCWEGPFEVKERGNEVTSDVMKPRGRGAVQTVHVNSLKGYHDREMAMNTICYTSEGTFSLPLMDLVKERRKRLLWRALRFERV